jgi:hypothetical protein
MLLTACFATQTSAGRLPAGTSLSAAGRLHDVGLGITTIGLLLATVLSLRLQNARRLRTLSVCVLILVLPADGVLLALGGEVGGIRGRLLVLTGCLWQLTLISLARQTRARVPE